MLPDMPGATATCLPVTLLPSCGHGKTHRLAVPAARQRNLQRPRQRIGIRFTQEPRHAPAHDNGDGLVVDRHDAHAGPQAGPHGRRIVAHFHDDVVVATR
jgi:hypothetical protein